MTFPSTLWLAAARVFFSPLQTEVNQGTQFSVTLSLDGGTDVAYAPLQIQFDPKLLSLSDVSRGGLLANDGQQPVFTKNVLNEMGTAVVQLNRQPGTPGVNGSGPLVTLTFEALARGATLVAIPNLVIRNSQGVVVHSSAPTLSVTIK